jgi:hypothetical protein
MKASTGSAPYSTGRLTRAQADVINRWRARLREDRPLPGECGIWPALRLMGLDDRPRASTSDVIAVAVADLMCRPPAALEVARRAADARAAQRAASEPGGRDLADAPAYDPVGFWLQADLADRYNALRKAAPRAVVDAHDDIEVEALTFFPADAQQRRAWISLELRRRRVPYRAVSVTGGVIARMAIERWAGRDTDEVIAEAVSYAQMAHEQWHRPHRRLRDLAR